MFNRIFALFTLVVFSPLFFIIGLIILIEDGFPIFFTQKRVGVNYSFFYIYKFRSMKRNTPNVATHLLVNPLLYLLNIGAVYSHIFIKKLSNEFSYNGFIFLINYNLYITYINYFSYN
jgi:O-antigen biosynthesis protein WbqP